MKSVKLIDICNPKQWKTIPVAELKNSGYPVYGANGIIGYYDEYNHEHETVTITCRGATCGSVNMTEPKTYVTGNAMCLDSVAEEVDVRYLYYAMRAYDFSKVISGSAQPQITYEGLSHVMINIAEMPEQRKIVTLLDKIEKIIIDRKCQLKKMDDLIKARFVEMFGDPVENKKEFVKKEIGSLITEVRYGTSKPSVEGGKYKYLRMNNITNDGHLDLLELKYIDIPDDEIEKCIVRKGDILFNRTNSIELVGKTCMYDLEEDMVIAGYIIRIRLNKYILPVYFSTFMNLDYSKQLLRGMAKGAVNQANINAQELQRIKVLVPPIELQNQFAAFVQQVDKSKFAVQKALDKMQLLFDSLMQEYFG